MNRNFLTLLSLVVVLTHCGEGGSSFEEDGGAASSSNLATATESPFEALALGDNFIWGEFINIPYETAAVTTLPIPLYLALFSSAEKEVIGQGIDMANRAVGYDIFEVVDEWQADARYVYKVNDIDFDEEQFNAATSGDIIGYTYHHNVYIDGKYDAGRIVTDWAMELRAGSITKWVVAHELGHAMGIQSHALIDYEDDSLTSLESNSLMSAVLPANPTLNDYSYMMQKQGELLFQYMQQIGASN